MAVIAFRFIMMPNYLQSYLNLAYQKMEEMKLEAGKISNIDLQKSLSRVFYYLCVVSTKLLNIASYDSMAEIISGSSVSSHY